MVTGRYQGSHGIQLTSALAALGLSAAMVSGLVLSSPAVKETISTILETRNIPLVQPTPEPVPDIEPIMRTKPVPHPIPKSVDTTTPVVETGNAPFTALPVPDTSSGIGHDLTTILPPMPTPTPAPVLTKAMMDARYARDFQPPYPPSEQRAGREGLVSVRVLVGADGRVKQIERIAAASDAFWAVTERQALTRWRFRPATRDGVPIEAWREMTVRFEMPVE